MAANWELQLISAILEHPERVDAYRYVLDEGLSLKHFEQLGAKNVWSFVSEHYTRPTNFGNVPSKESVLETYRNLDLPKPVETLEDLVLKIKGAHVLRTVDQHLETWDIGSVENPLGALSTLTTALSSIAEEHTAQSDVIWRHAAMDEMVEDLAHIETNEGMTGMPYPWSILNNATGGIQPGDFILLWALPKSKKTWIGLYIAVNLFLLGYRVVVYSKEMMWPLMRRRIICLIAQVDYAKFRKNQLSEAEKYRLLAATARTTDPDYPGELIFTTCDKADGSIGGPPEVRHKIDIYKPDFMMLDSSYMLEVPGMKDPFDWKAIANLTKQLKGIAKSTAVPMLGIMQENEKAALKYKHSRGTASIAMYSGMVMDADVGIKIVNNKKLNETSLVLAACRETDLNGFTVHTKLCTNMSFAGLHIHEMGAGDAPEEAENDTQERREAEDQMTDGASMTSLFIETNDEDGNDEHPDDEFSEDLEPVEDSIANRDEDEDNPPDPLPGD